MALIRPSIDLRQFSFSEEGSTYNEQKRNCICVVSAVCLLCHSKGAVPSGLCRRRPNRPTSSHRVVFPLQETWAITIWLCARCL